MGSKLKLIGQTFGRLTVISTAPNNGKRTQWICMCACGKEVIADTERLRNGQCKSCGCLQNKQLGLSHSRIYGIWYFMNRRCEYRKRCDFDRYGGRGVRVCDEWKNFKAFYDWAMSHGYRDDLTIDRIDTNGNYEPSNCRWADVKTQNRNRRNSIKINGISLAELSEFSGIQYRTLYWRIVQKGWPVEKALSTKVVQKKEA